MAAPALKLVQTPPRCEDVAQTAFRFYEQMEPSRSHQDWMAAIRELGYAGRLISPINPLWREVKRKAEQIWKERKDASAREDWYRAERLLTDRQTGWFTQ